MRIPIAAHRICIALLSILCLSGLSAQVQYPDNIVPADCADLPLASSWNIEQGAVSQPLSHMYAQPFIGDIDGDGLSEIVTAGFYTSPSVSNSIVIYGHNLQLKYSFNTGDMYVYGGYPLAVADVDGDGTAEIFIQNRDGHLRCYHPNGNLLWSSYVTSESNRSPNLIIADVNRDGIPEIMSLDKILNAVSGTVILSLPETIGCSSIYAGNSGHSAMPVFADFDNDGILEAAGGDKVYKLDISNSAGPSGNSAVLWKTISGSGTGDGLTSVADIDLDGFLDVVVVRSGHMFAWKPYSGTGSSPALIGSCPYTSTTAGSRALLTDVNNNGHPEILFSYAANIVAYQYLAASQSLQLMWQKSTSDLSGATTMTAFDFNQDGSVEIVFRDQSDLRIIDGTTGNNKSDIPCIAPTATENPAVADLDLDGEAEIIVSSSTYDSNQDKHAKLIVFKSPANASWAPARHVWNQHAYNVVNINDDLTVPTDNFNPATAFTDPQGVVRRPFNNFLQQATTLDQYGRPFMPLANVSATTDTSTSYNNSEHTFTFQFCNTGGQILSAPFHITYYANSLQGPIIQTATINSPLPAGDCMTLTLHLTDNEMNAFPNLTDIVVALNDNGQGVAQSGGQQQECDTTDNYFSFPAYPCDIPTDTIHVDVCTGETYSDDNFNITAAQTETEGTFYFSRTYPVGLCDSTIILELAVHPSYHLHITESILEENGYHNHGLDLSSDDLAGLERLDTTLSFLSRYGCDSIVDITLRIALQDLHLYLPNAITANGDGLNDEFFIPEQIQGQLEDFTIHIYNRWGELCYYSNSKGFRWDGSVKGKIPRNVTYQYIIHCTNLMGRPLVFTGSITVL